MIYGIQKLSLVDYPKQPAFVLFLGGCNFRCPFCHNESIVNKKDSIYPVEDILNLIEERKKWINAIVVTGGEPTIYQEKLIELLKKLKPFNLKIKLDTNGTNPILLEKILKEKLVDYIAMDIKNTYDKYNLTSGVKTNIDSIKKSIELIENDKDIEYEFRMTINKTMHEEKDIEEVVTYIKRKDRFFLQPYKYNDHQLEDKNFGEFSDEEIKKFEEKTECLAHI